jgi:hypothetical protein
LPPPSGVERSKKDGNLCRKWMIKAFLFFSSTSEENCVCTRILLIAVFQQVLISLQSQSTVRNTPGALLRHSKRKSKKIQRGLRGCLLHLLLFKYLLKSKKIQRLLIALIIVQILIKKQENS